MPLYPPRASTDPSVQAKQPFSNNKELAFNMIFKAAIRANSLEEVRKRMLA
ncbi:hypothetical protein IMZ68_05860 [Candidatus Bathyarchaeota archaeon]|nr:hypothetical protein [Candidatus Bathyarchaeota archaeon]